VLAGQGEVANERVFTGLRGFDSVKEALISSIFPVVGRMPVRQVPIVTIAFFTPANPTRAAGVCVPAWWYWVTTEGADALA
jgi:hypothetical protein